MSKTGPEIRDFDAIAPKGRRAKIGGRVVDVSFIPGRITLELARFKDALDSGELTELQSIETALDIVAQITTRQDPEMTADWLLDNAQLLRLTDFINYVLDPTREKVEAQSGNEEPASSELS
jgi:hypothetical protein